jgi:hypothetical protein
MPNKIVPAADLGLPALNRRSALAKLGLGLAASTSLAATAIAAPDAGISPDPIFALIEEHRSAVAAVNTYEGEMEEEAFEALDARLSDIWSRLFGTKPKTIAGVAALLSYAPESCGRDDIRLYNGCKSIVRAVETAAAALRDMEA